MYAILKQEVFSIEIDIYAYIMYLDVNRKIFYIIRIACTFLLALSEDNKHILIYEHTATVNAHSLTKSKIKKKRKSCFIQNNSPSNNAF